MPKKGKKGSSQKRGKPAGKPAKKTTAEEPSEEVPSTSAEGEAQPAEVMEADPPSGTQGDTDQAIAGPSADPPKTQAMQLDEKKFVHTTLKRCEHMEKIATSIQGVCSLTAEHDELRVAARDTAEGAYNLQFILNEIKKLAGNVGKPGSPPPLPPRLTTNPNDPLVFEEIKRKWPKTKLRVPYIFLHPPVDFRRHALLILARDIKIFVPEKGTHFTKILCQTFRDHEELMKYLNESNVPYHTFGSPINKMMRVVIRGISNDVDLDRVKEEMIAASIPVVRFHEMNAKLTRKARYKSILVVVPDNMEGRHLLKLKSVFGTEVTVEPPLPYRRQCHRCQKWGHSQRYCYGRVKCVKCAGEHLSSECDRDPEAEPLRCANCAGEHTASHRKCPHCPQSAEYKEAQSTKPPKKHIRVIMTVDNYVR